MTSVSARLREKARVLETAWYNAARDDYDYREDCVGLLLLLADAHERFVTHLPDDDPLLRRIEEIVP